LRSTCNLKVSVKKTPDAAVWEDIARAVRGRKHSIATIARRYRVTAAEIRARGEAEGWPSSPATKTTETTKTAKTTKTTKPPQPGKPRGDARLRLIKNLYGAVARKLRQISERIAAGGKLTIADDERQARTLVTMIRGVERILGLETDLARSLAAVAAGEQPKSAAELAADAERWRADLARRIRRVERSGE
jgi:predicted transcriptional regulator